MYTIFHRLRDNIYSRLPRRLTIRTLHAGPDYDKGTTVLHAAFQLLTNYIENEHPVDFDLNPDLKPARDEMVALYHWWKEERPSRPTLDDRLDGIPAPTYDEESVLITEGSYAGRYMYSPRRDKYPEYYATLRADIDIEIAYGEEDQRNLHRLVSVRENMWT